MSGGVIEIITDASINTSTDVGMVNLTQTNPILCGFINIDREENPYDLVSSMCMFAKQYSPFNIRLFDTDTVDKDTLTFVRVHQKDPAYFVCRLNFQNDIYAEDLNEDAIDTVNGPKDKVFFIKQKLETHELFVNIMYDDNNILIIG
jgi:hypothetical protein